MAPAIRAGSVLVVGTSHIDVTVRDNDEWRRPGRGVVGVAIELQQLGYRTVMHTNLGADDDGVRLLHHLLDANVTVPATCLTTQETSTVRRSIDSRGRKQREQDVRTHLPNTEPLNTDALHIGSAAAFTGPGADQVHQLAMRAHDAGRPVSFDARVRHSLIESEARARDRFEALLPNVDVLRLTRKQTDWLYPGEHPADTASRLTSFGPRLVALALGARGTLFATPRLRTRVETDADASKRNPDRYMAALIHEFLQSDHSSLRPADLSSMGDACLAHATRGATKGPRPAPTLLRRSGSSRIQALDTPREAPRD